ncbi:MAG: DUF1028 domain-containing protein, partial [Aigarchaeota archaeon]|nr:DUF1028 domain-containing protein [Aigarchaeota archaeon]
MISARRIAHTYSIVARDPETSEMGVAVQSHYFSVGPVVSWAQSGVGAVATQAMVDISYGPLGLELMRRGKTAQQALKALLVLDKNSALRQVAMLDANGIIATHTGQRCIPEAGHLKGKDYSVQANMMLSNRVWPSMAEAFEGGKGDLAERMLQSLEAAEDAGGDIRGKQSAAILIVRGEKPRKMWEGRIMDLRVEDHPEPLKELRRLVKLQRAYQHASRGDLAIEEKNVDKALAEFRAAERLAPRNQEIRFWHAVSLVNAGRIEDAVPIFKKVFERNRNWAELVPRLSKVDMLSADESLIKRIVSASPGRRV